MKLAFSSLRVFRDLTVGPRPTVGMALCNWELAQWRVPGTGILGLQDSISNQSECKDQYPPDPPGFFWMLAKELNTLRVLVERDNEFPEGRALLEGQPLLFLDLGGDS